MGRCKMEREWCVLLIGGASGSGKTCVSYPLAKMYGVNLIEVDDFQVFLFSMTKPEEQPDIHYWDTHPEWQNEGVENTMQQLINVGRAIKPGLEAVIKNHLDANIPVIIEGDFILPELSASFDSPKVRSIFIHEPSRDQILNNYLIREEENGLQHYRADVSHRFGNWLAAECVKYNVPVIESRPWDTVIERILKLW
jgi:2-phosphoglycerate kinase